MISRIVPRQRVGGRVVSRSPSLHNGVWSSVDALTGSLIGGMGLVPADGHRVMPLTADLVAGMGLVPAAGAVVRGTITVATTAGSKADTTNQNSYTSNSWSMGANKLYVAFILHTATTSNLESSVTDTRGSVTWAAVSGGSTSSGTQRLTAYYVVTGSSAPGSGTMTANYSAGDATSGCIMSIVEASSIDLTTPIITANVKLGTFTATTSTTVSLNQALETTKSVMLYGLFHNTNEVTGADTFTELDDATTTSMNTPTETVQTAYKVNGTTNAPSWATSTAGRWVSMELKAA